MSQTIIEVEAKSVDDSTNGERGQAGLPIAGRVSKSRRAYARMFSLAGPPEKGKIGRRRSNWRRNGSQIYSSVFAPESPLRAFVAGCSSVGFGSGGTSGGGFLGGRGLGLGFLLSLGMCTSRVTFV